MLTDFFSFLTSLSDKLATGGENENFVDFYNDYFAGTSVCGTILLDALLISLVIAVIYYFFVCNKYFVLAKRLVWLGVLAVVFVCTFFVSHACIIGSDNEEAEKSTGVYYSAYQTETAKLDNTDDPNERTQILETAQAFRDAFDSGEESLPIEMSLVNSFYAMLLFFVFSLIFKKYTIHGAAIPF